MNFKQMKDGITLAKKAGAKGIVFGLLTNNKQIDVKNTKLLSGFVSPLPVTFHKAICQLDNPVEGVKALSTISGVKRIPRVC